MSCLSSDPIHLFFQGEKKKRQKSPRNTPLWFALLVDFDFFSKRRTTSGSQKSGLWLVWGPETDLIPPTIKNSAGFPPPHSRGISSKSWGVILLVPLRGFSSALITSKGMVAAPHIHATLSECLAFFRRRASWLVIERDADCSSLLFHMEICASVVLRILKTGTGALLVFPSQLSTPIPFIRENA